MDMELLAQKLAAWIKEKVLAAGCKGAVLGMSGGIDSSVLAALCHQAFPRSTLGVIMPCHSIDEDKAHAKAVARQFSIPTKTVVLDGIFDAMLQTLPDFKSDTPLNQLARANLKARLRMVTLYFWMVGGDLSPAISHPEMLPSIMVMFSIKKAEMV